MSFLLNACIIYFTLLQGTTYSSNAEQFYVTYAPYVSLTYPPQASVPVVPGTLFGSGCSFIFRAPKISDRSTEPFAETKRFKRSTSAPLSAIQCHASVPCFRATSGHSERLWQGHIIWSSMFYAIRLGDAEPLVTKGRGDIQEDLVLLVFDAIRSPGPYSFKTQTPTLNDLTHRHRSSSSWNNESAESQDGTILVQQKANVPQQKATFSVSVCHCSVAPVTALVTAVGGLICSTESLGQAELYRALPAADAKISRVLQDCWFVISSLSLHFAQKILDHSCIWNGHAR